MDIQSAHPSLTPNYVSSRGDGKFSKSVAYKFVLNELLFLFSLRKVTVSVWPDRMIKPILIKPSVKIFIS